MEPSLSPEVEGLLRCPATSKPLRFLSAEELARMSVELQEGGWITEDNSRVYPVRDGFPNLIASEAIKVLSTNTD